MANVYYSVGTSTSDLKTGSPNIEITSGVATLSVAQTGNIGVGDIILANSISYIIVGKTSTSIWSVRDIDGTTAGDIGSTAVTSIKRAFNSLNGAINGTSSGIDALIGTQDLVTATFNLFVPCYADGVDSTKAEIDTWTCNATYRITIYTPTNTATECNNSQRHDGTWAGGGYNLTQAGTTFYVLSIKNTAYVTIDGLRIGPTGPSGNGIYQASGVSANQLTIKNNICKSNLSSGIQILTTGTDVVYIINNLCYDNGQDGILYGRSGYVQSKGYLYNNTCVDNGRYGINHLRYLNENTTYAYLKNNILQNNGTQDFIATASTTPNACTMDNTVSEDASANPASYTAYTGSNNKVSSAVLFTNEGSDDFSLQSSDTVAKDSGLDLSGDAIFPFNYDIIGVTRSVPWDIGSFDEVFGDNVIVPYPILNNQGVF